MFKVLMTADTVGGVWTYALNLARALRPWDVQFALLTMGAALSPAQRAEAGRLPNVQVYESSFRLEWMPDCWRDVEQAGLWMREVARDVQPDIIHLNNYAHGALHWDAPVLMVAHSCVYSWWAAVHGTRPPTSEWRTYRRAVQAGLRGADLVAAPTRTMLDAIQRHYALRARTVVIPNGISLQTRPHVRKEPLILSVGRLWDEAKNIAVLENIAAELPWPVYAAGAAALPDAAAAGFQHLKPLGVLPHHEVERWLDRAAIYALPARYEPFGLSVLEAAWARCALVLGDIPSLRENWEGAALFVPPDDPDAVRAALARVIDDPVYRHRYGELAHQRAGRFGLTPMAGAYLRAYQTLMRETAYAHRNVLPLADLRLESR